MPGWLIIGFATDEARLSNEFPWLGFVVNVEAVPRDGLLVGLGLRLLRPERKKLSSMFRGKDFFLKIPTAHSYPDSHGSHLSLIDSVLPDKTNQTRHGARHINLAYQSLKF